jgi:signal transduction histidine kinase/CheY-like chemotaxis protein
VKSVSGLTRLLLGSILTLLLCGCTAGPPEDSRKKFLPVNLNEYPLYVKSGFTAADTAGMPDLSGGSWQVKGPGERRRLVVVKSLGLPDTPRRFFLSPFGEKVREYTMLIPFTLNPEQFEKMNGRAPFQPGVFLAALGDNWEIFLNGVLVKSELHLDEDGRIQSHRSWRYISFPLDRSLFVQGTNILAFRIVGEPNSSETGLWYGSPYYIDGYETIRKNHHESLAMFLCAVYIFAGLYHLLLFFNRPGNRYNLYYCFFSTLLGIYFLMRSNTISSFIPDTNITFRLENASLFMLLPMLSAFLEHLSFGKTLKLTRICGGIYLLLAAAQAIFSNSFRDDILVIWQVSALMELVFVLGYDILYAFHRNIRALRDAAGTRSPPEVIWMSLTGTPLGNIIIGAAFMCVTALVDILNSINLRYAAINVSRLGLFIFTVTTTFILARRFGSLFRRLDEMNTLLEKTNLNLETTVRERTRELERQTEVANSASRAKSDFLARMSHEIRTPLNAILGLSEVELGDVLPDKTRRNLEKIYHSGCHLLEIINDILDISKIESGNFEVFPAEYEVSKMINDAIQLNAVRIGLKQLVFKLELDETIPLKLSGDELRIRQILNNLLSNAFKYTEEGEVRLRIGWERRENMALLDFAVQDTGRGIKPDDLGKLFSDYTQLEAATNRRIEGTGLGLSITKGLVERMGGTITAESEYGRGSTFRIILPQGIVNEKPMGRDVAEKLRNFHFIEDRNQRGNIIRSWMPYGKVLVVDDLPTNLDVMTGLLMPYGLRVDTVSSGREAVACIRAGEIRYDLIFMDHMMPEVDGVEAARIIRNEIGGEYARTVPIVVLTANAVAGNREMFLKCGFNDFIPKPIDIKHLDIVLNQWIRDIQSEETLREADIQAREQAVNREQNGPDRSGGEGAGSEGRWLLEHPVEGINFAMALTLYGNSGAALMPILKSFIIHTPVLIEKMDVHLESSPPDYTIEVHGLKGTCNAICAVETAVLARDLEFASREGNLDMVRSRHGELRRQALDLTGRLKVLLDEWEAGQPAPERESRAEPDRDLLERLSAATAEYNSNVTEEILGKLEQYRYEAGEELIRWLREQAENFDYDAIHDRLEKFPGIRDT